MHPWWVSLCFASNPSGFSLTRQHAHNDDEVRQLLRSLRLCFRDARQRHRPLEFFDPQTCVDVRSLHVAAVGGFCPNRSGFIRRSRSLFRAIDRAWSARIELSFAVSVSIKLGIPLPGGSLEPTLRQIPEDLVWSAKRGLCINHPFLVVEGGQQIPKADRGITTSASARSSRASISRVSSNGWRRLGSTMNKASLTHRFHNFCK